MKLWPTQFAIKKVQEHETRIKEIEAKLAELMQPKTRKRKTSPQSGDSGKASVI